MLTIHGRTRADLYHGDAEYETIAAVKSRIGIPVVANGDIDSPEKAKQVLRITGADALMIGRAAQGRPWIFREIDHYLKTGEILAAPRVHEIQAILNEHLLDHYAFYGEYTGLRTARKHIAWYCKGLRNSHAFRHLMNSAEDCKTQLQLVNDYFNLQRYLDDLKGTPPNDIYQMVLSVVEKPMLELVMAHAKQNQSLAASYLGINRNTLRKKLLEHRLI
jgi:tRNA-dihydrouridine synthase B